MIDFSDLADAPEDLTPRFHVQAPDGRKSVTEAHRQRALLNMLQYAAPRLLVFANANAGKRNPMQARREGIRAGVFDLTLIWRRDLTAYVEMKGYTAAGRPGQLSDAQVRFGNRLVELGVPCACFFTPENALDWLREQGFPIAEVRRAA